jgi:ribosomal-protein-serine acetyltransferase
MFSHRIDDRTELRPPDLSYAEEATAIVLRNLAHLRAWMPWAVEGYSVEDARDFIKRNLRQFAAGEGFAAFIFHEGRFAGTVALNSINWANRKTEIGYWLSADLQGRGIITRCCRALVNHSFRDLKLNRVEMFVGVENARSRAVPERLGFRGEGLLRQAEWLHDHFIDLVLYAMLADDWKEKESDK